MEWLLDPAAWVGLLTLVILEIVLGIDNLIFIAILADKLPPSQRDRARIVGLSLALVMRLALLSVMSWLVTLTKPLFVLGPFSFAGRDLILMLGGFFLLFKGTMELHERIEGGGQQVAGGSRSYPSFWVTVTQIVVLDAVFSLDSVITAVGMVDHLAIMMIAVIIAIGIMLAASKPLTRFVNAHPTVVVLCLGFLLMIGFSLLAEAFGFKVPKGYLYAAIGFSVLIEALNQVARRNLLKLDARRPMRDRTAEAVLRMLGKRPQTAEPVSEPDANAPALPAFGVEERNMVSGVLTLAERSIQSIMTPRIDMSWVDIDDDPQHIQQQIMAAPHSFFPVCRGSLDEVIGIGRAKDMVADLIAEGAIRRSRLRDPIIVHESIGILRLMDTLKRSRGQLVLVADEFGAIEGLVTPIDVFEAIAGEFPDEDEVPDIVSLGDGVWQIDGAADLRHVEQVLDTEGLLDESRDYSTLAGYLLLRFGQLPKPGDSCEYETPYFRFRFEVLRIEGRRIASVRVERTSNEALADSDHYDHD
ncbi:TerC family protein [Bordetella avium]|uniref:Membrane protein n=1 Tax=Bordetella avium (strain 197N) TaxID=360910 RepID=Q2KX29_BORA1|nr:TerC family protein [Bordetella avium]RIQ37684.1 TerC family protein [Bordetella avium]RIQ42191.1 TerC family protein [Bordetella avium]RIQ42637.1 TerC family protein [Bordetella avium]RIQ49100.1 TerC family protein [Bordetella avium]RIQ51956.1 TerC family protein [Bordetella avium]